MRVCTGCGGVHRIDDGQIDDRCVFSDVDVMPKRKFRVVFDDVNAVVAKSPFPAIARLTFNLVFEATSADEAATIMRHALAAAGSEGIGAWHVEEVA